MSCWLFISILTLARVADAQSPDPIDRPVIVPPETEEHSPDHARLDLAVRAYQAGQYEEARNSLAQLVNDPTISDAVLRQQARIYLGEILYVQGQEDAAFKVFETVLLEDPSFKVDPFRHPPDVCGFFEVVRASVNALGPAKTVTSPPLSDRGVWIGFGAWQRAHDQRRFGNLLMTGQVLLGVTSLATHAYLVGHREYHAGTSEETRVLALRAVQWTSTTGFWGLYAWGAFDARQRIQESRQADDQGRDRREGARGSAEAPVGVGVSGRW